MLFKRFILKELNLLFDFFYKSVNFFILKKNDELRFYVNYCDLNAIIIKNRYSLSLIFKTLNHLCELKIFTKLNFKNVYYKLRIKINNE